MTAIIVAGIVAGFTYSLAGASLAVAYRSSRTLNFALGGIGGFSAYTCLSLTTHHIPWAVALVVTMLVGAVIGGATDAVVGRRLRRASGLTAAMGIFGVLLFVQGVTELIWGSNDRVLPGPFGSRQVHFGLGVVVSGNDLVSVGVALACTVALLLVLYRTSFGLQMRAASAGPVTAQTVGIRVRMTTTAGWAIGGALGGASAVFVTSTGTLLPTTFSAFIFLALVALTLGGLTSIWGVVAGGLVFGVALNIAEAKLSTKLTYLFAYAFLSLLLLYRPQGLLGRPERQISEPPLLARPTQRSLLQSRRQHGLVADLGGAGALRAAAGRGRPPRPSKARSVVGALLVVAILFVLWYDGPTLVSLSLTQIMATFVAVIGLDILMGHCGQISLAHGAFLGVGAYASAIAVTHLGLPLAFAFPIGILAAALIGVVVGLPAIRLSGLYFAQITLLFALVVPELITFFASWTGGSNGLSVPQFNSLSPFELFLLYGAIAGVVAVAAQLMIHSSLGRHWRAARDDPEAAAGLGQRVSLTKLGAFAIGCGLAGLGGVMQAISVGSLSPDSYPVWESIYLQAAQVVGGMTSLVGNLLGAIFVTVIPVYTGGTRIPPDLVFGASFVLVLLVSPRGLGRLVSDAWAYLWDLPATLLERTRRDRREAERVPVVAMTTGPVAVDRPVAEPMPNLSPVSVMSPASAGTASQDALLDIQGLRAGYGGGEILHGIDLCMSRAEVLAIVGPNGAGKSTLLRAITGLVVPSAGRVVLDGRDITGASPFRLARDGVAHVVEGRGIFPDLTVAENLRLGARLADTGTGSFDEAVELFPVLGARMDQLGGTLSGGEQQMLALSRGLLMRPRLLILDEPLLGLAPAVAEIVLDGLRAVRRQRISIVIVEQNVRQVLELCDRAAVVAGGRVVRHGTAIDLSADTKLAETYFGLEATAR